MGGGRPLVIVSCISKIRSKIRPSPEPQETLACVYFLRSSSDPRNSAPSLTPDDFKKALPFGNTPEGMTGEGAGISLLAGPPHLICRRESPYHSSWHEAVTAKRQCTSRIVPMNQDAARASCPAATLVGFLTDDRKSFKHYTASPIQEPKPRRACKTQVCKKQRQKKPLTARVAVGHGAAAAILWPAGQTQGQAGP